MITSDWLAASALSVLSLLSVGFRSKIPLEKLFIILIWYIIIVTFTLIGLESYPTSHVVKNSLFFYVIPIVSLLNVASFVNKRFINSLITIIVAQLLVVVIFDNLGIEVFRQEGMFVKFFGYYSSGGTVVNYRYYSYNFVLLLTLTFIRIKLQSNKINFIDLILIVFSITLSGSKGIILAAVYPFIKMISFKSLRFNMKRLIITIAVICIFVNYFPALQLLNAVFDQDDISNITRLTVAAQLIDGFNSIWGNGFGASLPPELIRDFTRPYGFEVSYVSYYHKMGIFFLILCFMIIILIGFESILLTLPIWISAAGNPTLTHLMNFFLVYLAVCVVQRKKDKC
jgi:hypothetical protein